MKILDRYIYEKLTVYFLIVFPAFSLVSVLVELIEILRKAKVQDFNLILIYILAKLPENFYYIVPISLIISAFVVANEIIKSREIYPILLNGISINYISTRIVIFSIFISFLQVLNLEILMPKSNKVYVETYQKLKNQPLEDEKAIAYNLWLKLDEKNFIYFDFFDLEKKVGKEIVLISMDENFLPTNRWEAESFKVESNSLTLLRGKEITVKSIEDVKVSKFDEKKVYVSVDPEKIKKLIKEKKPVSITQLYKVAKIAQNYGYDASYFWSKFYQKLATVISPFILTVFAVGFIWRKNKFIILAGFLSTVLYWYGTSIVSAIASVGNIPYYFIFSFDILFLSIGFYLMFKTKHPEL
ncbi:MAG: LptF/LptG family permease [Sulfurihydrogenibium azorense]|uniref:LptF/LptG family permease n=1 Tax=Sulfurihydrogenibium azorense TaxID=309806 RepID=UPI003919B43C